MADYKVTEKSTGRLIVAGDTVTSFRGEPGVFQYVSRSVEHNGTAKVLVQKSGAAKPSEYYDRVWDLQVETLPAGGAQ